MELSNEIKSSNNTELSKLSKQALLEKCEELRITKCKSKNKSQLIQLINNIITDTQVSIAESTVCETEPVNVIISATGTFNFIDLILLHNL